MPVAKQGEDAVEGQTCAAAGSTRGASATRPEREGREVGCRGRLGCAPTSYDLQVGCLGVHPNRKMVAGKRMELRPVAARERADHDEQA